MRPNHVKQQLLSGGTSIGTMVFEFSTTGIGRLAAEAGAEFVIYDMEHSGFGPETMRMLMATAPPKIVPIVRVTANVYHLIAPQLDLGAMGIMAPMVGNAAAARDLVAATHYPPDGVRGAAFGVSHDDYSGGDIADKIVSANAEVLTIAQIETVEGADNVDEIAETEGLDVLWVGQFDLSSFLGVPGRFDDLVFSSAVKRVVKAAEDNDLALGVLVMSVEEARRWIDLGFRCIALGGDLWIYRRALAEGIADLRG